jgi:ABC-type transport system involved in cytochrome c biogenesis permease subunit
MVTARGADFDYNVAISKPKGLRVMFFSGLLKHKMLLAIVGPTISCGIFFMLAINYFREKNAFSCVLMILMCLMVLYIAIEGYKKVLKALP